jgi:hypothetical protein
MTRLSLLFATAALMALTSTASATPVATTEEERQALGRVFPEPMNSTNFIQLGPVDAPEEMKGGWNLLEKVYPGYVDFTTVAEELGDPNAVSPGPDGFPAWAKEDTKDGLPLYIVKVTDESVPDKDKQYVAYFNSHAAEPCGKEGTPRFLEDLLIWAEKEPDRVLDDGFGIVAENGSHKVTVRDLLRKTKLYWINVQPDGWAMADGQSPIQTGSNYNYADANSNRIAYQDGWVFPADETFSSRGYSVLQQPEGAAVTKYLRQVREKEMNGRPWATANDQHGPVPTGAVLLHDQGNDAAKVDRTVDYAARIAYKMDQVFARYATQTGLEATQAAAAAAGSVRDEILRRYTQITGNPVTEKAAFLTLEWAEYASIWEHLDYTVSGTWGGWASSSSGLGADTISFEVDCNSFTGWDPATWQLYVDNVRAINETAAVHAAALHDGKTTAVTYDLQTPVGFVETGKRVTDRDGNPTPPPAKFPNHPLMQQIQQLPYDVSNTDYFRDLRKIVKQPVVEVPAGTPEKFNEHLGSLVVSDTTGTSPGALREFAESGGNLVLTDSALLMLQEILGLPREAIQQGFAYVGYADIDKTHPWAEGLYKRARQMFDPVGLGYPLLMERDQYWPCGVDGACEESVTQNSAPIWSVDRAAWEAKGGQTIATVDPPEDRKSGAEGAETNKTEIGTLPLGKGRIVVFGGLLPQASEDHTHWFGVNPYTISVPGQQMLMRALAYKRDGLKPLPLPVVARSRPCLSGRAITIRLPKTMRKARVTLGGRRQKVLRGKRLRARIDLRRLRAGTHVVKIVGRTKGGRLVRSKRAFRTCAKRPR